MARRSLALLVGAGGRNRVAKAAGTVGAGFGPGSPPGETRTSRSMRGLLDRAKIAPKVWPVSATGSYEEPVPGTKTTLVATEPPG
ncbi:hypothetical protein [Streptomyces sp. NPDC056628]|uniref:hypothetical protein n=1 Tax=Streptomyces sp. NPDC056628 TaxID=3345882 RepID=UPI0036C6C167